MKRIDAEVKRVVERELEKERERREHEKTRGRLAELERKLDSAVNDESEYRDEERDTHGKIDDALSNLTGRVARVEKKLEERGSSQRKD